ncbi:PAS domain S-box protein [Rubrobacter marinus]|uniref:PAS domain S-box protein n=1 Tax=Rubrobacter marinus TaxID=2653852 RepID=UPI0014072BF4|nr:PAS domain S-box protein [Rubrobacter marinus]
MSERLRVLIVEDSPDDALLVLRELRRGGFDPVYERVDTPEDLEVALSEGRRWDLVISDYSMPSFRAPDALALVRGRDPDTPFVIVSGSVGEEAAVEAMKAGAQDYLMKDRLSRLGSTVARELREAESRRRYREAEEALRASEERFRATFAQAAVGMAHVGVDGRWLRVNRRLCEILGYGEEELLGLSFQDITHPDDLDADLAQVEALLAGEIETYSMEKRYLRKEGSVVWVELTVSMVREPLGGPGYFVSVVEDVTKRKRADEALRLRDRAIAASSNGIVIADAKRPGLPLTYVNPAFEAITGYGADEALGRNCRFLQAGDRDQPGIGEMREAVRRGRYAQTVVRNYRKDGTPFYNEVSISPVYDDGGRLTAFVGVQNDITERIRTEEELRRSEDRLRLAVEATGLGTWDYDLESREMRCNERLRALLGLEIRTKLDYETFLDALHPEHRERVERLVSRALDPAGSGHFDTEYRTVARDGTERWVAARGQALFEDGRAVRFVGTALEITERKKAEEAQRFLADAGTVLSSSLDYRATLRRLAQLVVPALADWCAVDMLDEDGRLIRLAVAHPDPEKVDLAWGLHERFPPDPGAPHGVYAVLRSGLSQVVPEISEEMLDAAGLGDEQREILRELELRSSMVVPLVARDRTLGAITFIAAESGRHYGPDDLELAEELARRAAMSVDNARLYEEAQREIRERELAEEALREQTETLEKVNSIGRLISSELDLQKLVQAVTDEATALTGARFGAFFYNVLGNEGETYTLYTISGVPREAFSRFPMPRATEVFGPTFMATGPVRSADIREDPRYGKNAPHHGMPEGHLPVASYLAVPVVSRSGEALGGLFFGHPEPGVFGEREEKLAIGLAAQAAIAIDNARLFESVRRSEERFGSLVRNASDIVSVLDAGGTIRYQSPAVERILGHRPEDMVGNSAFDYVHPEDARTVAEAFTEALSRAEQARVEYRFLHADGSWRYLESAATDLLSDPSVRGVVVNSRDVTERKEAEEALRYQSQLNKTITDNAASCLFMMDVMGCPTFMNPAAEAATGYTLEELRGRTLHDSVHHTRPDGSHYPISECPLGEALDPASTGVTKVEEVFVRKDGTFFPVSCSVSPLDRDGERVGAVLEFQDVTERKRAEAELRESEERYRAVVEQTAECLFLFDASTKRILETNTACQKLFGYTAEEFRGMTILDMVADGGGESVDSNVRQVVQRRYHKVGERLYRRKDGSTVDVEVTGSLISYGGHGEVVCGVVRDITERKRAEQRMREVREEERRRIARDLHDEVLSDLVYALQDVQIREAFSENGKEEGLADTAEALRRSVEGLRAAIFEMRLQESLEHSFSASLRSLVELNRRMSRGRFEVELEIGEGFPSTLPERQGRELVRVLQEAINNARRHSGAQRIKVSLGLEGDLLWAEVSDDGRGFDATAPQGGIGSSSMKQRASGLGGELEVRSAPGRGTTVRFFAPLALMLQTPDDLEAHAGA